MTTQLDPLLKTLELLKEVIDNLHKMHSGDDPLVSHSWYLEQSLANAYQALFWATEELVLNG